MRLNACATTWASLEHERGLGLGLARTNVGSDCHTALRRALDGRASSTLIRTERSLRRFLNTSSSGRRSNGSGMTTARYGQIA